MIKYFSRLDLSGSRIDREKGVIKGVSLIALGDARGHDKKVDQKTLEQVRDCAKTYGSGLRVKFNPSTFQHGVGSLLGFIPPSSLRIEDNKTVGDLHLYENFPNDAKEYLYEIAEKTPGNIGLSIEFSGDDEEVGDEKFARCDQIYAATVVDLPAANPTGLFAEDGDGKKPYGDVTYADPGYQKDKQKRYPIDTEEHVRAAWSYINQKDNSGKYSSEDLTKVKNKIKSAAKKHGIEISEEMIMNEEIQQTLTTLTEEIKTMSAAFKVFAEAAKNGNGNGDGNGDKGKKKKDGDQDEGDATQEELAAAGVSDGDDEGTKKEKLAAYRGSLNKPVSSMTARELIQTVTRGNMQFFRETGNRPVKTNAEPRRAGAGDPFEQRVASIMANGCKSRGRAIMRARQDCPAEYNAFMAKKHPNVQHMAVK